MKRIRALDGVRGLALLAVLGYHTFPSVFRGGFVGVEIFFVLSGFLLASLLLRERERNDRIDFWAYAGRRARRIFPALFVLLAALIILGPLLAPDDAFRLRGDVLSSVGGATNWKLIVDGSSYFEASGRPSFVRHLWSIAIELQFYVLCPWLVAWVARRRRLVAVGALVAGIAASSSAMAIRYAAPDPSRAYFGTDARIGALLTGVLVAVIVSNRSHVRHRRATASIGVLALAVVIVMCFVAGERARSMYPYGFLSVQAATAVTIALCALGAWPERVMRSKFLRWFGKRSYGIYLWHWPIAVLVRPGIDVGWARPVSAALIAGGGCLLGALSFRYIEQPFIDWRPQPYRWLKTHASMRTLAAAAAVALVAGTFVRPMRTTNPIEASLAAGELALAEQSFAPPPARSSAPTEGPVTAPRKGAVLAQPAPLPPAKKLPRGPAPGSVSVTAIGDSVMLGAVPALKERLGPSSYIDAAKSRQFKAGIDVVRRLREQNRLGRVVVIHLGNNGPVKASQVDEMMRELSHVAFVRFLTVRVDRGWQDSVNTTLRDAARRHHTIRLVDWYSYSNGHRDWFQSDGTHLRKAGADEYAKLVGSYLPPPPTPTPSTPKPTPKPTPTPAVPVPSLPGTSPPPK